MLLPVSGDCDFFGACNSELLLIAGGKEDERRIDLRQPDESRIDPLGEIIGVFLESGICSMELRHKTFYAVYNDSSSVNTHKFLAFVLFQCFYERA